MLRDLQDEILKLKRERGFCILAHSYMSEEICEIADCAGDSFALAKYAATDPKENILLCGVRFMAETCKLLSPQKKVVLATPDAGCPMAEQMDKDLILQVKKSYPDYAIVAYVNTTAELKTIADVCVTSSSAEKICRAIPEKNILFIPDINLGKYVAARVPEKNFKLLSGGCPTHARVDTDDVKKAKAAHPNALFLVHPECRPEVVALADFVGSTTGIMEFAEKQTAREFIIGTENSIADHLSYKCPNKRFYPLSKDLVCHNMKITTLSDVKNAIEGLGGEEITLPRDVAEAAKKPLERMIALGG